MKCFVLDKVFSNDFEQSSNEIQELSEANPNNFSPNFYNPFEIKHRRRTTRLQLRMLEKAFLDNPKPTVGSRQILANSIAMSARSVQVWFQNRRAKEKQGLKIENNTASTSPLTNITKNKKINIHSNTNHYFENDKELTSKTKGVSSACYCEMNNDVSKYGSGLHANSTETDCMTQTPIDNLMFTPTISIKPSPICHSDTSTIVTYIDDDDQKMTQSPLVPVSRLDTQMDKFYAHSVFNIGQSCLPENDHQTYFNNSTLLALETADIRGQNDMLNTGDCFVTPSIADQTDDLIYACNFVDSDPSFFMNFSYMNLITQPTTEHNSVLIPSLTLYPNQTNYAFNKPKQEYSMYYPNNNTLISNQNITDWVQDFPLNNTKSRFILHPFIS